MNHAKQPSAQGSVTAACRAPLAYGVDTQERIRAAAYYLYEQRGRQPGRDQSDWFEAERIIRQQLSQ